MADISSRRRNVLVANYDPGVRAIVTLTLSQRGFAVTTARSLQEAISSFQTLPADMVMLDMLLPISTADAPPADDDVQAAREFVEFLRDVSRRDGRQVTLIGVTALGLVKGDSLGIQQDDATITYRQLNAPFGLNDLLGTIERAS